jgi:enolase-phosphatase E1
VVAVRAILLDIEGTTTSIDFVYRVLFPYARARVRAFLGETRAWSALSEERRREGEDAPVWHDDLDSAVAYVLWLMDHDRKSTALKDLQGRIWERGYQDGEVFGEVYSDVPAALRRWRAAGRSHAIFSSGSVLAQKLLFAHSSAGDLSALIDGYFDTTTGPKREAASYRRIATDLQRDPREVLFLSDVAAELDAAREAGMQTALCVRPPAPDPAVPGHRIVHTFDEI